MVQLQMPPFDAKSTESVANTALVLAFVCKEKERERQRDKARQKQRQRMMTRGELRFTFLFFC
jgi:hypothetical protein